MNIIPNLLKLKNELLNIINNHTHSEYASSSHTHSEYALTEHTHSEYALTEHTHSEYASSSHTHSGYASSSHTHNIEKFSSSETAIGTWIDGKTIYRKCFEVSITSTSQKFSSGLTYSNIDILTRFTAVGKCSIGQVMTYGNDDKASDYMRVWLNPDGTIQCVSGTSYPGVPFTLVVIMEYTKV